MGTFESTMYILTILLSSLPFIYGVPLFEGLNTGSGLDDEDTTDSLTTPTTVENLASSVPTTLFELPHPVEELDETKVVLHQTLEGLLNRGEKLDDLVSRSDMLSQSSKAFYTTARKTNSWCCTIM